MSVIWSVEAADEDVGGSEVVGRPSWHSSSLPPGTVSPFMISLVNPAGERVAVFPSPLLSPLPLRFLIILLFLLLLLLNGKLTLPPYLPLIVIINSILLLLFTTYLPPPSPPASSSTSSSCFIFYFLLLLLLLLPPPPPLFHFFFLAFFFFYFNFSMLHVFFPSFVSPDLRKSPVGRNLHLYYPMSYHFRAESVVYHTKKNLSDPTSLFLFVLPLCSVVFIFLSPHIMSSISASASVTYLHVSFLFFYFLPLSFLTMHLSLHSIPLHIPFHTLTHFSFPFSSIHTLFFSSVPFSPRGSR